jgi:hypothetical protein
MGAAVLYSVELLEECFGDQLDDSLKSWRRQFDSGIWSVDGCGGHACGSKVDVAA